jgi:hypothetical protein
MDKPGHDDTGRFGDATSSHGGWSEVVGAREKSVQMLYEKPNSCYIFSLAESDLRVLAAGRTARGKGQENLGFRAFAHNLLRELRAGEFFLFFSPVTH